MPRKKTNEEFVAEMHELVGNEYTFLEPYINSKTKIKVRHNVCGTIYSVIPNNFRNGTRCPYCFHCFLACKPRKTNEKFLQEVQDLVGNEYTFLEPYVNATTNIKVRHNLCKQTYSVQPASFLNSRRCPYCANKKQYTTEEFAFKLRSVNSRLSVLDQYQNNKTKIKVRCNDCGHTWYAWPGNLLAGSGCPKCATKTRRSSLTKHSLYQRNRLARRES